jgi:hypothetical protein
MSRECQGFGNAFGKRRVQPKIRRTALQIAQQPNLDQIEVATGRINEKDKVPLMRTVNGGMGSLAPQDTGAAQCFRTALAFSCYQ